MANKTEYVIVPRTIVKEAEKLIREGAHTEENLAGAEAGEHWRTIANCLLAELGKEPK